MHAPLATVIRVICTLEPKHKTLSMHSCWSDVALKFLLGHARFPRTHASLAALVRLIRRCAFLRSSTGSRVRSQFPTVLTSLPCISDQCPTGRVLMHLHRQLAVSNCSLCRCHAHLTSVHWPHTYAFHWQLAVSNCSHVAAMRPSSVPDWSHAGSHVDAMLT